MKKLILWYNADISLFQPQVSFLSLNLFFNYQKYKYFISHHIQYYQFSEQMQVKDFTMADLVTELGMLKVDTLLLKINFDIKISIGQSNQSIEFRLVISKLQPFGLEA